LAESELHNERLLLTAISRGDEAAFEKLFDYYSPKVYHIAGQFTHSSEISKDIVQDVFMKVWLRREMLSQVEDMASWLFILTRNLCINALNRMALAETRSRELAGHLPFSEENTERSLDLKDMEDLIHQALALVTDQQRRVFELARLKGLSREEIADEMDLSPNTVKMHLVRATRVVRGFLASKMGILLAMGLLNKLF